ncbi:hypothetical protein AB9M62_21435 [Bacillales bacterium AN1005]
MEYLPEEFEQKIHGLLSLNTDVQSLKNNVGGLWVSTLNWIENININLEKTSLSFL